MNETVSKFNLYDHLWYVLVGLFQITWFTLAYHFLTWMKIEELIKIFQFENTLTLVFASYLLGHCVQALSNIFSKWEKSKKDEKNKQYDYIINNARTFFSLPENMAEKIVWQYCYLFALSRDFSGQINLFNSLHSLYRWIWIASTITAIITIAIILINYITWWLGITFLTQLNCIWVSIFILLLWAISYLFNERRKRFLWYMSDKVLIQFDILSKKLLQ